MADQWSAGRGWYRSKLLPAEAGRRGGFGRRGLNTARAIISRWSWSARAAVAARCAIFRFSHQAAAIIVTGIVNHQCADITPMSTHSVGIAITAAAAGCRSGQLPWPQPTS